MHLTPEQTLKAHQKASAKLMREIGDDPKKARAYLIKLGVLEKDKTSTRGVRFTKKYRTQG